MALTALIALITRTCVIRRAEATADHGTLAVKSTRTSIAWIGKWRGGSGSDRGSWRRCQRRRRRRSRRRRRWRRRRRRRRLRERPARSHRREWTRRDRGANDVCRPAIVCTGHPCVSRRRHRARGCDKCVKYRRCAPAATATTTMRTIATSLCARIQPASTSASAVRDRA